MLEAGRCLWVDIQGWVILGDWKGDVKTGKAPKEWYNSLAN